MMRTSVIKFNGNKRSCAGRHPFYISRQLRIAFTLTALLLAVYPSRYTSKDERAQILQRCYQETKISTFAQQMITIN